MIIEYHRPEEIGEAVALLKRSDPVTLPLGGGTVISRRGQAAGFPIAVVDLQRLNLDKIRRERQTLKIGTMVTLQALMECEDIPAGLRASLHLETALNMRQMATVAGTIVSCDGRSPFVTALLALDARLEWAQEPELTPLGDYLVLRPVDSLAGSRRVDGWITTAGECKRAVRVSADAHSTVRSYA